MNLFNGPKSNPKVQGKSGYPRNLIREGSTNQSGEDVMFDMFYQWISMGIWGYVFLRWADLYVNRSLVALSEIA